MLNANETKNILYHIASNWQMEKNDMQLEQTL